MLITLSSILIWLVVIITIPWGIGKTSRKAKRTSYGRAGGAKKASAMPNQSRTKILPNIPKKLQRTRTEEAMQTRTRASRTACDYKAAYSKGSPDRIGLRGDYTSEIPAGTERIRCAYCGAENFVPVGTRDHYHCYFCWEKL